MPTGPIYTYRNYSVQAKTLTVWSLEFVSMPNVVKFKVVGKKHFGAYIWTEHKSFRLFEVFHPYIICILNYLSQFKSHWSSELNMEEIYQTHKNN